MQSFYAVPKPRHKLRGSYDPTANSDCVRLGSADAMLPVRYGEKKLQGLSPRANYTDRATAACRRRDCQLVRIEGATWSA
jgi:hypothetical protein